MGGFHRGLRRGREMQALYLVIFQMQQSSAKIKFIRFSMDIAVHFPPSLAEEAEERWSMKEWKEKTANATYSRT